MKVIKKKYRYLLQQLVVQSVRAVKLKHHVSSEGVFDAANHVFSLCLSQLHRLRRLEERAKSLELWDGCQLFCQTLKKRFVLLILSANELRTKSQIITTRARQSYLDRYPGVMGPAFREVCW